jgi:hypothetical protein
VLWNLMAAWHPNSFAHTFSISLVMLLFFSIRLSQTGSSSSWSSSTLNPWLYSTHLSPSQLHARTRLGLKRNHSNSWTKFSKFSLSVSLKSVCVCKFYNMGLWGSLQLSLWTISFLNNRNLSQFLLSLSSHPIPSPPSRHSSTPPANESFTRRDFFPRLNNYKFFCTISNIFNKISLSLSLSLRLFITTTTTPSLHNSPSLCNTQTLRGAQSPPVFQTGNVSVFLSLVPVWCVPLCVCVSLSLSLLRISLSSLCGESPSSRLVICRDANARGFPAPRRAAMVEHGRTAWRTDGRTVSRAILRRPEVSASKRVGRDGASADGREWLNPRIFLLLTCSFFSSKLTIFLSIFSAYCNPRPKC